MDFSGGYLYIYNYSMHAYNIMNYNELYGRRHFLLLTYSHTAFVFYNSGDGSNH
jgi:hypothetical protein